MKIPDGKTHGGEMMDFNFLGFDENLLLEISNELSSVVKSGFWSGGPCISKLEDEFNKIYDLSCASCSSGGMALELVANAFPEIKRIAIQSNTYFATALPWINRNKEIILIGTEKESLTPSLEYVKDVVKIGIDAIILTHIGGYPIPDIEKISNYCKSNGVLLIEDCAHSPLTKINDKYVGKFGDASILSFFPTKPIPAGEGGMVFFKDKKVAAKVKQIRDYGKEKSNDKILHKLPAVSNGRLNNFSASIVLTFLKNYKKVITQKKKIAKIYDTHIPKKYIYQCKTTYKKEVSYYKYITFLKDNKYSVSPVYDEENQLFSILKFNNINFKFVGDNPLGVKHICLPITPNMVTRDAIKVVESCVY